MEKFFHAFSVSESAYSYYLGLVVFIQTLLIRLLIRCVATPIAISSSTSGFMDMA